MSTAPELVEKLLNKDQQNSTTNSTTTASSLSTATTTDATNSSNNSNTNLETNNSAQDKEGQAVACAMNGLIEVKKAKSNLDEVSEQIDQLITIISTNPSYLSVWSNTWGNTTTSTRAITGLTYVGTPLAIGTVCNIPLLITIAGLTGISYAGAAFLLDDHFRASLDQKQQINKIASDLTALLSIITNAFDAIHNKFARQIEIFQGLNQQLTATTDSLSNEVRIMIDQNISAQQTTLSLERNTKKISNTISTLKKANEINAEIIKQKDEQLAKVSTEYAKSQQQLQASITALEETKKKMAREIQKNESIAKTLMDTWDIIQEANKSQSEKREIYNQKLAKLVNEDSNLGLQVLTDKLGIQEQELITLKNELQKTKDGLVTLYDNYSNLMALQSAQMDKQNAQMDKQSAQMEQQRELLDEQKKQREILSAIAKQLNMNGIGIGIGQNKSQFFTSTPPATATLATSTLATSITKDTNEQVFR